MYVLIQNGAVKRYPYGLADLQRDNPNTSFASAIDSSLEAFGVFRVYNAPAPEFDPSTHALEEEQPTFDKSAQRWTQVWVLRELTPEEAQQRRDSKAEAVRMDRNAKLTATDWTQGKDIPDAVSQPWAVYRQALRDVPSQAGFPWEVVWPDQP